MRDVLSQKQMHLSRIHVLHVVPATSAEPRNQQPTEYVSLPSYHRSTGLLSNNQIGLHQYEVRLSRLGCIIMRLPFAGIGLGAAISLFPWHLIHSSQNNISSTTIVFPVHVAGEEQKYRSTD